jgi:CD109 antigen
VRTNKPIDGATYQIIGKGKILDSKFIKVQNSRSFAFTVKPTVDMLPTANVLVYYIEDSGEIISDFITVEFGNQLKNFVRIEIFFTTNQNHKLISIPGRHQTVEKPN